MVRSSSLQSQVWTWVKAVVPSSLEFFELVWGLFDTSCLIANDEKRERFSTLSCLVRAAWKKLRVFEEYS